MLWLLKNSLTGKWSKKLCNRKPYKRRSPFWYTFSISQIPAILTKQEFFNTHEMLRQLRHLPIRRNSDSFADHPPRIVASSDLLQGYNCADS
jgi:hypothetical protein